MNNSTLLAIDLAKNVFQLHGVDNGGNCVLKKRLTRKKFSEYVSGLSPTTLVMETCSGANYWARYFQEQGHTVKLISPQFVKPYVKGNKTDSHDAEAIAEAAQRPNMRFVPVKSRDSQDIQTLHRMREQTVNRRTALVNQIRGLLADYGVIVKQGVSALKQALPSILEDAENTLSFDIRHEFQELYEELCHLTDRINRYTKKLEAILKSSAVCQRLMGIRGVGVITSTAILSLGDLNVFKNGRHFSAYMGMVPKEHSSGNTRRQYGITKRGNTYIRTLLVHGARAVLKTVDSKDDALSLWCQRLKHRVGMHRACIALANKLARVIWRVVTSGETFDDAKVCALIDNAAH